MINKYSRGDYLRDLAKRMKAELEGKTKNIDIERELSRCNSDSTDIELGIIAKKNKS